MAKLNEVQVSLPAVVILMVITAYITSQICLPNTSKFNVLHDITPFMGKSKHKQAPKGAGRRWTPLED